MNLPIKTLYAEEMLSFNQLNQSVNELTPNNNHYNNTIQSEAKIFEFKEGDEYRIICAPMHVCLIKLHANEKIMEQFIGDPVRWQVVNYKKNNFNQEQSFIAIKPQKADLQTNYIVIGNSKTYTFNLQSNINYYMNLISFKEDAIANAEVIQSISTKSNDFKKNIKDQNQEQSKYKIIGQAEFQPLKIETQNNKTYIYLPKNLNELPIFIAKTPKGESKAVNARWLDDHYMIDEKIIKGELIRGSGRFQEKVEIIYQGDNDLERLEGLEKNNQKFERN